MVVSNATDLTFHGLRSRMIMRSSPVPMAVTEISTVAAIVYPRTAITPEAITATATHHSNHGLPSWSSET
ncbi:hypothetical protein BW13_00090 [Bifidobacterium sp. UTCIF-37]|nr:hypothetical protein BW13_00090 [Bifidobacterium sp. UTCIF-37]TPF91526.1 hypothetical protein BW11_00090 [Bifidobacterium sp. UTCIF-38]